MLAGKRRPDWPMFFYATNLSSYELGLEDLCLQNELT
jgi:hypothetical protein